MSNVYKSSEKGLRPKGRRFFCIFQNALGQLFEVFCEQYMEMLIGAIYQVKEQPDDVFNAMEIHERRKYVAVGGHGTLEYFTRALGDIGDYYKITTLRDPIDRIISEYNYIQMLIDKGESNLSVSFDTFSLHYPSNSQVFALTSRQTDVARAVDIRHNFFNDWALFAEVEAFLTRICDALDITPQNWSPLNETNYRIRRNRRLQRDDLTSKSETPQILS